MDKIQGEKFKQFVEDNRKGVCARIMRGFKLSEDDAQDIYQESIIALYNNIDSEISTSLDKFFSGIWYRQALKFLRRQKRVVNYDISDSTSKSNKTAIISSKKINEIIRTIPQERITPRPEISPEEAFDLNQMKERVYKALDEMAQQCKNLLTKYYLEGYNWAELAAQFELKNADTAKAAANRCRRRFEEKYKGLEVYIKN